MKKSIVKLTALLFSVLLLNLSELTFPFCQPIPKIPGCNNISTCNGKNAAPISSESDTRNKS